MKLTWYGQAAFGIEARDGTFVVTDPYDPDKAGYRPFPTPADLVVKSSSDDDYHDNDHLVPKREGARVIDALELAEGEGVTESHGIAVQAIEAGEHEDHPSGDPDRNAMYRLRIDGLEIGHMGDMGNDFSEVQLRFFEGIDVLLAHAGGFPVISLAECRRVIEHVRPRLVVPMHFRTLALRPQTMHWIGAFVDEMGTGNVDFATRHTVEITRETLPERPRSPDRPARSLVLAYR